MSAPHVKLLRTISFDQSDRAVYDLAAADGEWAVSGAFAFADSDLSAIKGKPRQAFANGFLGLNSFGRSTFAVVCEATADDRNEAAYRLARHFVERYGAPDVETALPVADSEIDFAAGLADGQPINTVLTVRRIAGADGGIKEEFRTIRPPSGEPMHARVWTVDQDET